MQLPLLGLGTVGTLFLLLLLSHIVLRTHTAHLSFCPLFLRRLRKLDDVVVWPCFSREMLLRGSGGGLCGVYIAVLSPHLFLWCGRWDDVTSARAAVCDFFFFFMFEEIGLLVQCKYLELS